MNECPDCLRDIPAGTQYCPGCGALLLPVSKEPPEQTFIDRFQLAQYEADLIGGGLMRWINRIYGPKYGQIRRIIIDVPWPPDPMTVSCLSDPDAAIISKRPDAIVTDYATPMLGLLQEKAREDTH